MQEFNMSKADVLHLFDLLNEECKQKGIEGEIVVFDGTAIILTLSNERRTRDIDAIFAPKNHLKEIIEEMSAKHNLPRDWLNEGVKGFIYVEPEKNLYREWSNLKIYTANPEYLLAMKIHSSRALTSDRSDVELLCKVLNITTTEEAMEILERYVPHNRIEMRSYYFISDILGE